MAFSVYAARPARRAAGGGARSPTTSDDARCSSRVDRRELVSMLVFVLPPDIGWLVVARAIQGLATGLATSVFSVAIVEQAFPRTASARGKPRGRLGRGGSRHRLPSSPARWCSSPPTRTVGLPHPCRGHGRRTGLCVLPRRDRGTASRRAGVPAPRRLGVPVRSAASSWPGVPGRLATWMFAAFFLGLGPAVLGAQRASTGGLVVGFTTFLAPFTAAVSTFASSPRPPAQRPVGTRGDPRRDGDGPYRARRSPPCPWSGPVPWSAASASAAPSVDRCDHRASRAGPRTRHPHRRHLHRGLPRVRRARRRRRSAGPAAGD